MDSPSVSSVKFNLGRFLAAQRRHPSFEEALEELRAGKKRTHWMWYIFPQFAGLGSSEMAERYAIESLDEAKAYLEHSVLGPRLLEATRAVLGVEGKPAIEIFGSVDAMKFRSSMTLFHLADREQPLFEIALERFFGGVGDPRTEALVQGASKQSPQSAD